MKKMNFNRFRVSRRRIRNLAFAAASLASSSSFAWVHLAAYDSSLRSRFLTDLVVQTKQFDYCIDNESSELYSDDSLRLQVAEAIAVWSRAFAQNGVVGVHGNLVACRSRSLNLKVLVAPLTKGPMSFGAYQSVLEGRDGFVSPMDPRGPLLMQLNVAPEPAGLALNDNVNLRSVDTGRVLGLSGNLLQALLSRLTLTSYGMSGLMRDFKILDQGTDLFTHLSFRLLVHEFGHTFGLGDTYSSGQRVTGSPKWQTPGDQPEDSVMHGGQFFQLQQDDLTSLKVMIQRSSKEIQ